MRYRLDEQFSIYDNTPVENLFIEEYMLKAPGDFVKVYLYALKQCYYPAREVDIARALGMEPELVEDAITYWERQELLKREGDGLRFYNLKHMLFSRDPDTQAVIYKYRGFNTEVQTRFGTRLVGRSEYETMYLWLDELRLPEEVVLIAIEHCIEVKGRTVGIKYIDAVVRRWGKDGLNTAEAARDYVRQSGLRRSGASKVLRHIGQDRRPTVDEAALYDKWTKNWKFSQQAILEACAGMTRTGTPNFAYLDKILEGLHQKELYAPAQIERRGRQEQVYKDILHELNLRETLSPDKLEWLDRTIGGGVEVAVIKRAAKQLSRRNGNFEGLQYLVEKWMELGVRTEQAIDSYLSDRKKHEPLARDILESIGEDRPPTPYDLKCLRQWIDEWKFSPEMIRHAAQLSSGARAKFPYMHALISEWKAGGVDTVDKAKASRLRPQAGYTKKLDAQDFSQRKYAPGELDRLFEEDL